jgi:hypothetical protein
MKSMGLVHRMRCLLPRLLAWSLYGGLIAAGTGCSPDPCDGIQEACLTVDVRGDVGRVEALGLDLEGAYTYEEMQPLTNGGDLPVTVFYLLPLETSGELTVRMTALRQGETIGVGQKGVSFPRGGHARVAVDLTPGGG